MKVRALRYIDAINEKSEAQQIQFLTGFRTLLLKGDNEFSQDVNLLRFATCRMHARQMHASHTHVCACISCACMLHV